MANLFKRLFSRKQPVPTSDEALVLQSEAQRLRMALEEAQAKITRLEAELRRQQNSAEANREDAAQARLLAIFNDLAAPTAQFLLQLDLVEKTNHTLQVRDTLAVARSLLRVLQNYGLEISEPAGTTAAFDPSLHEPLSSTDIIQPGQPVSVRLPGLSYHGRRLRKAGVSPQES